MKQAYQELGTNFIHLNFDFILHFIVSPIQNGEKKSFDDPLLHVHPSPLCTSSPSTLIND
jgi:hypothetical protein